MYKSLTQYTDQHRYDQNQQTVIIKNAANILIRHMTVT